jgi:hypothetical protein
MDESRAEKLERPIASVISVAKLDVLEEKLGDGSTRMSAESGLLEVHDGSVIDHIHCSRTTPRSDDPDARP